MEVENGFEYKVRSWTGMRELEREDRAHVGESLIVLIESEDRL